jgi:hypothetical protein
VKNFFAFIIGVLASIGAKLNDAAFSLMQRHGLVLGIGGGMDMMPTASDFERYRVTNPDYSNVFEQPLFDYNIYPGAGTQRLPFFQTQVGAGITSAIGATAATPKTDFDTNMQLAGQLSSGIEFMINCIEVQFYPGSVSTANTYTIQTVTFFNAVAAATVGANMNDANTFYQSGKLTLTVLSQVWYTGTPLINFVPTRSFDLSAAVASNSATTSEVGAGLLRPGGLPTTLTPPIALQPSCSFDVTLSWPGLVALPSGFNARVGVILTGYQRRAGQ